MFYTALMARLDREWRPVDAQHLVTAGLEIERAPSCATSNVEHFSPHVSDPSSLQVSPVSKAGKVHRSTGTNVDVAIFAFDDLIRLDAAQMVVHHLSGSILFGRQHVTTLRLSEKKFRRG